MTPDLAPPCRRCGAEVHVHHPRLEHLRMYGWRLFAEALAVNACGHRHVWFLVPHVDRRTARLVPILGGAT